jgi:GNAT superfamily N-acetyltransferase
VIHIPPLVALGFGEGGRPSHVARPPAPPIEFAPLDAARVAACATIDRLSLEPAWSESRFHRELALPGTRGTVALYGASGRVVGYYVAAVDRRGSVVRVLRFAVSESLRRRGVATRLFARVAEKASDDGQARVEVPVPETLAGPRRFLQAIGFRGVGVGRSYYGDIDAYILMRPVESRECEGK